MIRRGLAAVILGPSLLIGSLAWSGFLALRTVFDEDRSRDVAEELLDNEEVRTQLADNLGTAIAAAIPAEVAIEDDQIDAAADQVLGDPVVEELIVEAFARTHAAFLGEGDAPRTLDLTPVAERARAAVVAAAPQVESTLPEVPRMEMTLPTDRIPDASPVRDLLRRTVPLLAAIAAVGVLLALFTTSDRPSVLRRAGFWALTTTAFYLAIGLGLPWLIRLAAPEQAEVIAALLTALLRTTLTPSIVLALVAAGLIVASFVWPEGARTHRPRVATSQGSVGYAPPPGPGRVVAPAPGAGPGRVVAPAPGAGPGRVVAPAPGAGPGRVVAPAPGAGPGRVVAPAPGAGPGRVV
ncbi:MAG: hypothetical protein ACE5GB_10995, partial [Acidimicrobiales bacterium]